MDISNNGNQPFSPKEFPDTHLICNGEIYNFKELKERYNLNTVSNSDTEVLLELYKKIGTNCLNDLNGIFAFALYD